MSVIFILMLVSFCSADHHLMEKRKSFTMDLIHRDSLLLGQHNYSRNSPELLSKAVLHSSPQASRFSSSGNFTLKLSDPVMVMDDDYDYLMRLFVSKEKYEVLAFTSTASDLVWINCNPCRAPYGPKSRPYARRESTYKRVSDTDPICDALNGTVRAFNECKYKYSYGDDYTGGILSTDNFYLKSEEDHFTNIVFGCSHYTIFKKLNKNINGNVGLGRGELSLISQLAHKHGIKKIFAYCLVPRSAKTHNSKIRFGENEIIGSNTARSFSTPIYQRQSLSYYYLSLKGIRIGEANKTIYINTDGIMNSGNFRTFFPSDVFRKLAELVEEEIGIQPTPDPSKTFNLCFEKKQLGGRILPQMVLEFDGGDLHLENENMFVDYGELKCLAIFPSKGDLYAIGSTPQIDFWVEYDLKENTISFTPTDCTQLD